jgi:pilus assembly protein CpaF
MSWSHLSTHLSEDQRRQVLVDTSQELADLPLATLRNRPLLAVEAERRLRTVLRRLGHAQLDETQFQALHAGVLARIGGLGFLDGLLPPASFAYTDLIVNGDGSVWGRRKGEMRFDRLDHRPSREEVWRAVEALLSPQGRACTEATPSVDARLPRDRSQGFGGARVKVLHPAICAGEGYPSLALRLYEPDPVPPERMVQWGVLPPPVMDTLLGAIADRLRLLVVGGTATGKTTLLSALCHGIPTDSRIVKVEDPEEIWLPHANVTTLEARPAPPGSDVPSYTVADGVDDALRLAPTHLIVGEVRTGDAALSLFRALMSDHAGLTTFHAEGPAEAVFRLGVILFADAGVHFDAARALFAQAIDLVVQVGWQAGQRRALGVWEVEGLSADSVAFRPLWTPDEAKMDATKRKRR